MPKLHEPKTSHLYGTLEPSGFKGFPSKVYGMKDLNPPQPIPEVAQARIRRTTNTGQLFNYYNKELAKDTVDKFPHYTPGTNWKRLSEATGSYGATAKASNPETIVSFGLLPTYPEEERIHGQLARSERTAEQRAELREKLRAIEVKKFPKPAVMAGVRIREKYDAQKIRQLEDLGFPPEVIEEAINEEVKKDISRALANPGLLAEQQVQEAIGSAYAAVQARRDARAARLNFGQGAGAMEGAAGGMPRPPGVEPFNAGSLGADIERARQYPAVSMLGRKQQVLARMRAENAAERQREGRERAAMAAEEEESRLLREDEFGFAARAAALMGRAAAAAGARGVAAGALGGMLGAGGGGGGMGGF